MEFKDYVGKPCKSRLAFEFIPKKHVSLDLKEIAQKLVNFGIILDVKTSFLLIFRFKRKGISLFNKGKIIVKDTNIEEDARRTAEELVKIIG